MQIGPFSTRVPEGYFQAIQDPLLRSIKNPAAGRGLARRRSRGLPRQIRARFQARESSDNPMLNAFCRVAPSVRFKVRAMIAARRFLFASAFNVRTCSDVQARRFDFLAI
jgi:hypothetical protein